MDAITPKHFAIIRVAKAQLGMTEEDYRALLRSVTGQESAKALTPQTFKKLMDRFEQMGFRSTAAKKDAARHPDKATEAQRRKIRALWEKFTDGEGTETSLRHWMENRGYGSSPEFLDGKDAPRIIGALTNMVTRRICPQNG